MFSFSKLRKIFFIGLMLLATAVIFTGCPSDPDDDTYPIVEFDTRLVGTWADGIPGEWYDGFRITSGMDLYKSDTDFNDPSFTDPSWGGKIVYAAKFSENSGILIIQYGAGLKQTWYDYSEYPTVKELSPQPAGNFYGIYYDELKAATVKLSATSDQKNNNGPCETVSLQQAINRFTLDAKYDWMYSGLTSAYPRVD